jgi:hypothetical protein
MPNRQPPNDPNLERDLWGDDDRPAIDLQRKQRDDRADVSNWEDEGETSNWDDADDYGREYDEPGYGSGLTTPNFSQELEDNPDNSEPDNSELEPQRDSAPANRPASNMGSANIGDPELFDTIEDEVASEQNDDREDDREAEAAIVREPMAQTEPADPRLQSRDEVDRIPMTQASDEPAIAATPIDPETRLHESSEPSQDPSESRDNVKSSSGEPEVAITPESEGSADSSQVDQNQTDLSEIVAIETIEVEEEEAAHQADAAVMNQAVDRVVGQTTSSENMAIEVSQSEASSAMVINDLAARAQDLRQEIAQLQAQKSELQSDLSSLVQESLQDLKTQRQELQASVEKLERRQARIQEEMQTTFAGASQDLAVRVQGFKEYLVGSLQDLSLAAERLKLAPDESPRSRTAPRQPIGQPPQASRTIPQDPSRDRRNPPLAQQPLQSSPSPRTTRPNSVDRQLPLRNDRPNDRPNDRFSDRVNDRPDDPSFGKKGFQDQASFIRSTLDRYRDQPDYYGPPWQLRRTFQPVQAERVSDWFFNQSGRGVVRSMGSRLQNILIASTTISILRGVYDKRLRTLVLANSPERLGEWRRGLQDCLGITRNDFGPDRGITLFEDPMLMAQKAERLVKAGWLPLIVMDESEAQLNLSLLQFPLWLAFAADPSRSQSFDRDWMVR